MNNEFYHKLVDLYADDELPEELANELETVALHDEQLNHDMRTLRGTVQLLKATPKDGMSDVCYQRVLRRILDEANLPEKKVDDRHQYRLKFGG